MPKDNLEEAIETAFSHANRVLDFASFTWRESSPELKPRMHQLIRMHEVVRNKTKRMICADTTGAGKTLTAVGIKGLMDRDSLKNKGEKTKSLVIAPNQALYEAWSQSEIDRYTKALGLPHQECVIVERGNIDSLLNHDFILVNYDKFSIPDTPGKPNDYLRTIKTLLPNISQIIIDECHNLKNIGANRTVAFTQIIEKTKHTPLLLLSASPFPNTLKDAGFLLYMLDPLKYSFYAKNDFDYITDRYSIRNEMNSGKWFTFTREDIKLLFNLPNLNFGDPKIGIGMPHRFTLRDEDAMKYFEIWKQEEFALSKIVDLSRSLLSASIEEVSSLSQMFLDANPDGQIAVYSFYTEGISDRLKDHLEKELGLDVTLITGKIKDPKERVRRAKAFRNGEIPILVNTYSVVSESISFATQDRPSLLILWEPPIVPAVYDQVIGRFYRPGLETPLTVTEMIPQSDLLNKLMEKQTERKRAEGVRFRRTWKPGTIFEDKREIRQQKSEVTDMVTKALDLSELIEIANADEGSESEFIYKSLHPKSPKLTNVNVSFNDGLKTVRSFIGMPIDELLKHRNRFRLLDSYVYKDWEKTSSADTNRAITQVIRSIEEETGRPLTNILDWGCGTACLARILKRPIYNLDLFPEMILEGIDFVKQLEIYDPEKINDYFLIADAREMQPFSDNFFDLVSSSYAIQYNSQGYKHKRDVEMILLQTNRILKENGYGIFAFANQATGQQDILTFENDLLPRYGFKVLYTGYITGHAIKEDTQRENKVFQGFSLLLYQKQGDISELVDQDDIFVHSPYKRLGIGGFREIVQQRKASIRGYKTSKNPAFIFRTSQGMLQDHIKKSLREVTR